jgi:hypothetical protein
LYATSPPADRIAWHGSDAKRKCWHRSIIQHRRDLRRRGRRRVWSARARARRRTDAGRSPRAWTDSARRGDLPIARQIGDALAAAHDQGVIHRDLKPANIKLRPDGTVKVLDFGLAKVFADESGASEPFNSPTLSLGATHAGVILGTAAYMSPEQARGKAVDKRTDVWAFGCVLYEMLAGRRAFAGDEVSDTWRS